MSAKGEGSDSVSFGVNLSKDLMVPMRDGVRLATDLYRPALDGELVEGQYPAILCRTPYDKTDRRYSEIADFFVPHGYAVCLQDCRDRYRSEGSGDYFHAASPREGEDGYDTIEWIADQSWANGKVGTVGSSYAAITQVRAALERPPHLTAIWPDVVPTNSFLHQAREGGAMQLSMFWALFIHAQDAQDISDSPELQDEIWHDLSQLRQLFWETPFRRGQFSLRHVPNLDETLNDYYARGEYDEYWAQKANDFTRHWDEHADVPATFTTGWFDQFVHADTEYYQAMAERNRTPQRLVVGPWSHVGMRGTSTHTNDVDFGAQSVWGVARYFEEQLQFFDRWMREADVSETGAPVRVFVMGGGSGRKTARGKLDHGGRWRDEREWPLARAIDTSYYLHTDGALRLSAPEGPHPPLRYTYDPRRPVPTVGGSYTAIGELPPGAEDLEPAWTRFLSPVLRLRNVLTPGPTDQVETPELVAARNPYPRLRDRPDVLVFETDLLDEPVEVTGRAQVILWVSSDAIDTDFTVKLIDVYPPNEDYPDGYDMILCDSIIRTRYREGFEREVFMDPGEVVAVEVLLPPTSNLFAVGHRVRIDVSSSNFPRLDRNPNTGEPIGRHTHERPAEQAVYADGDRPSRVRLPVIPV